MASTRYGERVIKVVTFNLEHDGGAPTEDGRFPRRWHDAHDCLREIGPDILLRQEMTYSRDEGHRRLHAAETALGLRGFLGGEGVGRNPAALFVNTTLFDIHQHHDHILGPWRTRPVNVVVRLPEVPDRRIILLSWHLAFNSPGTREREAEEITAFADKMKQGYSFIGGGDANEYPVPHGEQVAAIDWSSTDITDRPHMVHRSRPNTDGTRTSCTYLDETLLTCGLHDPARHAAHHLGTPDALNATAGHTTQAQGQGGERRIDRTYTDPWTITALLDVVVHDVPFSDHKIVEAVYSHERFVEAQRRAVTPLPPYDYSTH